MRSVLARPTQALGLVEASGRGPAIPSGSSTISTATEGQWATGPWNGGWKWAAGLFVI